MKDDNATNIFVIVVCVLGAAALGIWYLLHPCLEWKTTDTICNVCLHQSSTGACLSWREEPCQKTECMRRK